MLASLVDAPLDDPQLVYEPKYDGIRAIAEIATRRARCASGRASATRRPVSSRRSHRRSRRGRGRAKQPLVLDGEIVALDADGEPTGFQQLQGRIHLADASGPSRPSRRSSPSRAPRARQAGSRSSSSISCATGRPTSAIGRCIERRAALQRVFGRTGSPVLRISDQVSRRRARAVQAGAGARLGRADRQARGLALQVRQAHA